MRAWVGIRIRWVLCGVCGNGDGPTPSTHPLNQLHLHTRTQSAVKIVEVRLPSVERGAFEAGVLPFLHLHAAEPMQAIPRVRLSAFLRLPCVWLLAWLLAWLLGFSGLPACLPGRPDPTD